MFADRADGNYNNILNNVPEDEHLSGSAYRPTAAKGTAEDRMGAISHQPLLYHQIA